jgi:hypothetical protein
VILGPLRPHLDVPKRGPRPERRITIPSFSTPALEAWVCSMENGYDARSPLSALRSPLSALRSPLFPAPRGNGSINDVLLGLIVREALEAIGFQAPDMSPRVLRNTYARRQLLAGRTNADVTMRLGLSSQRTVVRLRATIYTPSFDDAATAT